MSARLTDRLPSMSDTFSFQVLRRFPDLEADNLVAVDATDRLVLSEAAAAIEATAPAGVVVVGDRYGAMTLGAIALHRARDVRVHQDPITGEQALARNAIRVRLANGFRPLPLTSELFSGATVVIGQLPKSLDALREITQLAAAHAGADVTVILGGRVKHMTHAMNGVLGDSFTDVQASLAHQKSRVLIASGPRPAVGAGPGPYPLRQLHLDLGLWVCAHGAAFAGTKIDIGTRFLLEFLDRMQPAAGDGRGPRLWHGRHRHSTGQGPPTAEHAGNRRVGGGRVVDVGHGGSQRVGRARPGPSRRRDVNPG
jgi:16S rRNA (guanine1207-N2)-methyltransferase